MCKAHRIGADCLHPVAAATQFNRVLQYRTHYTAHKTWLRAPDREASQEMHRDDLEGSNRSVCCFAPEAADCLSD